MKKILVLMLLLMSANTYAVLGPELVVDGDFEANSPSWEFIGAASRETGSPPPGGSGYYGYLPASCSSPDYSTVKQDLTGIVEFDVLYQRDCDYEKTGGVQSACAIYFGDKIIGYISETPMQGTFSDNYYLKFVCRGISGYAKIDNVSLKKVIPSLTPQTTPKKAVMRACHKGIGNGLLR